MAHTVLKKRENNFNKKKIRFVFFLFFKHMPKHVPGKHVIRHVLGYVLKYISGHVLKHMPNRHVSGRVPQNRQPEP